MMSSPKPSHSHHSRILMPTLLVGTPEHSRKISGACSRLFSAAGKHAIIPNTRSTDLFIVTVFANGSVIAARSIHGRAIGARLECP